MPQSLSKTLLVVAARPLERIGLQSLLTAADPSLLITSCADVDSLPETNGNEQLQTLVLVVSTREEASAYRDFQDRYPDCPTILIIQSEHLAAEIPATSSLKVVTMDEAPEVLPELVNEQFAGAVQGIALEDGSQQEMVSPITKLHRPGLPPDYVERPDIIARLESEKVRPLALVAAPAGYGKTALVSSWLDHCDWPAAWITLTEADSDLRRFLRYLIEGIGSVHPDACRRTLNLINTAPLPGVAGLVAALASDLGELSDPFHLVLDDLHRIAANSPVHEFLDQLLQSPPIALHLVIATRRDPPLSLRALRASGQVFEVRMRDLAFNGGNTRLLIERISQITVNDAQLQRLQDSLEGWPVGLRLLGLALRRSGDPDSLLNDLSHIDDSIQHYLAAELVNTQAEHTRQAMLELSILERFCPSLVEAVCARDDAELLDGAEFLSEAARSGLPVLPVDGRNEWFRYHHTFQGVLLQLLNERFDQVELAALHLRACDWLLANDLVHEAIEHALRAGDLVRAADIVAARCRQELEQVNWIEVESWLDQLPAELVEERPELLAALGWTLRFKCDYDEVLQTVTRLESLPEENLSATVRKDIESLKGGVGQPRLDNAGAITHLRRALASLGNRASGLEGGDVMNLIFSTLIEEGPEAAQDVVRWATETVDTECRFFHALVNTGQVQLRLVCGEHKQLRRLIEQSALHFPETAGRDAYRLGCSYLYTWELAEAAEQFDLAATNPGGIRGHALLDLNLGRALVNSYLGRPNVVDDALAVLGELGSHYVSFGSAMLDAIQARIAMVDGDRDAALRWAAAKQRPPEGVEQSLGTISPSLLQPRILLEAGDRSTAGEALHRLEALRPVFEPLPVFVPELQVLTAMAQDRLGDRASALAALEQAIAAAAPQGTLRPFAESLPILEPLLEQLQPGGLHQVFIDRVLALAESAVSAGGVERTSGGDVLESLTDRELDILELLAERLQNKTIAARLYVSPETVKSHLKNLYQKLGVRNRREAAALARYVLRERRTPSAGENLKGETRSGRQD